jgi:predicted ATPase/Tfp pilus assembly protein PilF
VLGVRESAETPLQEALKERLREGRILLLLDNFEQVMAAGPLISGFLSAAPNLKVMVTTRQLLHLYGEYNFPVHQMTVPAPAQLPSLTAHELSQYEAVRLFAERAAAARHGLRLTEENARSIAHICILLDGLPLGIELAASLTRDLSPEEVKSRLAGMSGMMSMLAGGPHDVPPRQQALRSAIEWSYNLLDGKEAAIFRCVSAFVGGFTTQAASVVYEKVGDSGNASDVEEVATTPSTDEQIKDTFATLLALCDKSLLYREGIGGEERFWMLETLREYAEGQLVASGEEDVVRGSHAHYYLAMVKQLEPLLLRGEGQAEGLERLEREHGNLLAALGYLLRFAPQLALRMSGAMWPFWEMRGHISEWQAWIERVLREAPTTTTRAHADALHAAGRLSTLQGDYLRARARYGESLAIRRGVDDKPGVASSLNNLGILSMEGGDYPGALGFYRESLHLRRELGDRSGVAALLNNMANILLAQGNYPEARLMHEESLAIRKELGNPYGVASSLQNLGIVAMYESDYGSATRFLEESLVIRTELGYKHGIASLLSNLGQVDYHRHDYESAIKRLEESLSLYLQLDDNQSVAECLITMGDIAAQQGDAERAARLFGAADAQMRSMGFKLLAPEQAEYERNLQNARVQLGEERWIAAWAEGKTMSSYVAASYALEL